MLWIHSWSTGQLTQTVATNTMLHISPHSGQHQRPFVISGCAELTDNLNSKLRPIILPGRNVLDLSEGQHAVYYFTEYNMFAVEEITLSSCYEELNKRQTVIC